MYVIWLHRIKLCLCVPEDPPDTQFDCVGVNGEGSYYTAVVGGVSNVGNYVTAEPNVPECASCCESFSNSDRVQIQLASPLCPHYPSHPLVHIIIHHRHANFRKDPHRKDHHTCG